MLMGRIADEWKSREMGIDGLVESNRSGGVEAKNINVECVQSSNRYRKKAKQETFLLFYFSLFTHVFLQYEMAENFEYCVLK